MKQRKIKLTERKGQGQFSKDIGKWVAEDGTIRYRRWYLGNDKAEAERLANLITAEWKIIKLGRGTVWTAEAMRRIELHRAGIDATQPMPTPIASIERSNEPQPLTALPTVPERPMGSGRTIYSIMVEYEAHLDKQAAALQCSQGHRQSQQACLRRARKYLTDMPIGALTYGHLLALATTLAGRPMSERGEPMAVETIVNTINAIKLFFGHVEDSGEWNPSYNWRRALRIKRRGIATDDEKNRAKKTPLFTQDDLRRIWNIATERTRLYMLLALNTGATQMEISTLRLSHVHLDDAIPYIERPRNKTGVDGRWPLWSETVTLLRKYLAEAGKHNPKGWAILNENGAQLLRYTSMGRADAITLAWQRTVYDKEKLKRWRSNKPKDYKVVGLPADSVNPEGAPKPPDFQRLGFKYLRKTGYSWIKKQYGTEVAEWYSQHKEKGMVGNYSDPCWDKVAVAVQALRSEFLPPMFKDSSTPLRLTAAEMIAAVENGTAPGPTGVSSAA